MITDKALKIDVLKEEPCSVTLNIAVPVEEVKQTVEKSFQAIQTEAELPGFRKGKVPLPLIKTNFSGKAREKALDQLISSSLNQIFQQRNISSVGYPQLKDLDFSFDQEFRYTVIIETTPQFELKKYFGLELTKEKESLTNQKVEAVIKKIQKDFARLEPSKNEIVNDQSVVVVDSEGRKNQLIDLTDPALFQAFSKQIVGMKIGEEKEIEISEKKRYFFKITGIKEKILPELNDQFAQDLGFSDFAMLEKKIKENLEEQLEKDAQKKLQEQLFDKLLEMNKFSVPVSLIEKRLHHLEGGGDKQKWEQQEPELRIKYKDLAERLVRLSFILSAIIKQENISVSDAEINQKIENIIKLNPNQENEFKKYLQDNKDSIELQLEEEKAIRLLLDRAKIKEEKKLCPR